MNKSRACCLGFTSALVIACGVLTGVLLYLLGQSITEGFASKYDLKYGVLKAMAGPYWIIAVVIIIPAVFSFIAAFVQNKCYYIVCCIISLICVAISGLAIFFFGLASTLLAFGLHHLRKDCYDDEIGNCVCKVDYKMEPVKTPFKDCSYLDDTVDYFIASTVLVLSAWILLIVTFVITIVYACRSKRTSGTVYTPAQQPMITHSNL